MAHRAYNHRHYRKALADFKKRLPDCEICGQPVGSAAEMTADHKTPVSDFPPNTPARFISQPSNLRPAHRTCNMQRGRKLGAHRARKATRIERNPAY